MTANIEVISYYFFLRKIHKTKNKKLFKKCKKIKKFLLKDCFLKNVSFGEESNSLEYNVTITYNNLFYIDEKGI